MRNMISPFAVAPAILMVFLSLPANADAPSGTGNNANTSPATVVNQTADSIAGQPPEVSPHGTNEAQPPGVAASVNGENILISDVFDAALRTAAANILDQLTGNVLIDQEAKKENIVVAPDEIDARISRIRNFIKPKVLEDDLKQRHMTMDELRGQMSAAIEIEKLTGKTLPPVRMCHVREILVRLRPEDTQPAEGDSMHSQSEAKAIIDKIQEGLKAGKKFEDLAKTYSDDTGSKDEGGDIGIITDVPGAANNVLARMSSVQPALLEAVFALKSGEVTRAPITTEFGYLFIKAISTKADQNTSEKDLYNEAESKSRELQFEKVAPEYVQAQREKANVQIYFGVPVIGPAGVAASVNGENITISQVSNLALTVAGASIVDEMITAKLVEQEAKKLNITVDAAEIDAKLDEIRARLKPKTLEQMLDENHMSLKDFRKTQRFQLEAAKLLWKSMEPLTLVHARHILILTKGAAASGVKGVRPHSEAEAKAIIAKIQKELKAGKKFEDLARQYTEDPESKKSGGDLGIIQRQTPFGMDVFTAAQALKKGEVTPEPVKSGYGLHLIMAESTNADYSPDEKQLYANAEKYVHDMEVQLFIRSYLKSLRSKNQVVNYME